MSDIVLETSGSTDGDDTTSGFIPSSQTSTDPATGSIQDQPEVIASSQIGLDEDRKTVSEQQPKVDVELNNEEFPTDKEVPKTEEQLKTETSQVDSDQRTKEAEVAFLKMFGDLRSYLTSDYVEEDGLYGAHNYILRQEKKMPLEWRTKRARDLSFMFHAYLRLMEDRITTIEDEIAGDKKGLKQRLPIAKSASSVFVSDDEDGNSDDEDGDSDDEDGKKTKSQQAKSPGTIQTLNRVLWLDFKRKWEPQKEGETSKDYAIDVLVGNAVIPHDVWRNRFAWRAPLHLYEQVRRFKLYQMLNLREPSGEPDQFDLKAPKMPSSVPKITEISGDFYPPIPDRIRINGEPLKELLEKALEVDFKNLSAPVVLIKPFKLLVQHKDRIRSLYVQLKQKFEHISTISVDEDRKAIDNDDQEHEHQDQGDAIKNEEINDLLGTYGTEEAYKELSCLIEFMDQELKILEHFEKASVSKIAFSDLWHIFPPGAAVVTSQKPINAYRVFHVTGGRPFLSPPEDPADIDISEAYRVPMKSSDFVLHCYQVDFDGNKFGAVSHSFSIQKYDDLKDITTLPIYPLKFAKDAEKVKEMLYNNGKTFIDVSKGEHVQYRGLNLHEAEEIDSEIVVDFHAALWDTQDKDTSWHYEIEFGIRPPIGANAAEVLMVSAGGCIETDCCENDYIFDDLSIDHQRMEDFLSEKPLLTTDLRYLNDNPRNIPKEDLIIFPHRVFAFVLKDRKWAIVDINNVRKIPDRKNEAWNSLVLPPGHKDMVYSLVQAHFRDKQHAGAEDIDEMQADLIRGKGKGLIILLHGAPGVGKTSTAECVAELCKRPLYPITCGDLGITAVDVETRLKRIFIQAQKWKCVLLLDEADVFLSERENNVKHNSLVSVFLRVLEYYQGILFLTTNRVGKMDEAFRSRVHISLYYPPLDQKSTIKIFRTNFERTKTRKGDKMKLKQEDIEAFAIDHYEFNDQRVRWNGRQIRNAFHIAIALAENEAAEKAKDSKSSRKPVKPTLRAKHFQMVEEASSKFDEYLTSVLGMGQSDRARQKSYRKDDWEHKKDRKTQNKGSNKRRPKHYGSTSDSSASDGESLTPERNIHTDDSNDESQSPARKRNAKSDTDNTDTERSEDKKNLREKKRDATRKSSRNEKADAKDKEQERERRRK